MLVIRGYLMEAKDLGEFFLAKFIMLKPINDINIKEYENMISDTFYYLGEALIIPKEVAPDLETMKGKIVIVEGDFSREVNCWDDEKTNGFVLNSIKNIKTENPKGELQDILGITELFGKPGNTQFVISKCIKTELNMNDLLSDSKSYPKYNPDDVTQSERNL